MTKFLLKLSIAENNFPKNIFQYNPVDKTALSSTNLKFQFNIPAFRECQSNHEINFLRFNYHDFFDEIIGLSDLVAMNVDLTNKILTGEIEISILLRQPDDVKFSFLVNPHVRILKSFAVNILSGGIIIKETHFMDHEYKRP